MPRGDGTGPMGMGPMTGRAAGFCAGYAMPGYANGFYRRGFGMGFGRGRGWRNMFYATGQPGWIRFGATAAPLQNPDPEIEKQTLKNQAEALQSELDFIRKRLDEIETANVTEKK
jgi:hypothetical protein